MANWVLKGLRTGIRTTGYPSRPERAAGVSPGRPHGASLNSIEQADTLVERCPTRAIERQEGGVAVDHRRCVYCLRCQRDGMETVAPWDASYEWATEGLDEAASAKKLQRAFGRSLHIRFLDAGACSACVSEARQLNNPYYNMHRLGLFTTPTFFWCPGRCRMPCGSRYGRPTRPCRRRNGSSPSGPARSSAAYSDRASPHPGGPPKSS